MTLPADLLTVDGLQINNWDRDVLSELRAGGVHAVNATCAVWEGPADTLATIGDWLVLARENPDLVALATTADDIRAAHAADRTAVLLGFQNTSPFADDYRLVEVFHRLGVRIAQLTYNIQNLVGGSCYEPEDSGLTRFGATVVAEMNRVGMLVDLSHVGERTSRDAVEAPPSRWPSPTPTRCGSTTPPATSPTTSSSPSPSAAGSSGAAYTRTPSPVGPRPASPSSVR